MAPKKSKANPRDQYFQSIKSQKLDTLRWCLRHGGVSHRAEDDEGHNGLMVAAAGGLPRERRDDWDSSSSHLSECDMIQCVTGAGALLFSAPNRLQ